MDRRDFFKIAWKQRVWPVVVIAALAITGFLLAGMDFSNIAGAAVAICMAIGAVFVMIIRSYWWILLAALLFYLFISLLKKFVFPAHSHVIDKLFIILLGTAMFAALAWINYGYYRQHQYDKMIGCAVMAGICLLSGYLRRQSRLD